MEVISSLQLKIGYHLVSYALVAHQHVVAVPGCPILMEHIHRHRFYLEKKEQRDFSIQEAALSRYDNIYSPLRDLIRENKLLDRFPHRTEADFYIWILKHKNRLFQDVFEPDEAQNVIDNYIKLFSNPVRKFFGKLRLYFWLVKY